MHLLTRHATLICRRPDGGLEHHTLPLAPDTPPVLWLAEFDATALQQPRGVRYQRAEGFLTASAEQPVLSLAHDAAAADQLFLPVTPETLADLGEILRQPWLIAETRAVIPRRHIRLLPDFRLRIGDFVLDLAASDRVKRPADQPAGARLTRVLVPCATGPQPGREIELVAAGPRNSALLHTEIWPVRSRRVAEMLVLAAHRQLRGHEPEQAMLEEDVAFLRDHGGPAALGDLMERLAAPPRLPRSALPLSAGQPSCPIIGLGTVCVVANALQQLGRDLGLPDRPMPFDWLTCTPAMVRHCIEDDFALLLDPSQYRSLPPLTFGNPNCGAEHLHYKRAFGISRVFNHSDPTRRAGHRYLELCVDRFRTALADPGAKLFVQIQPHERDAAEEFAQTSALLEALTPRAMLLQIVIAPPDRRRRMPLLGLLERRGAHCLYHLRPTSQMHGAWFERALDMDFLVWIIATHASRPATDPATQHAERADLRAGLALFGDAPPDHALQEGETAQAALITRGQIRLNQFLARAGLPRRVTLAADPALPADLARLDIGGQHSTLWLASAHPNSWQTLRRALGLIYLLDIVLRDQPIARTRRRVELGDAGHLEGAIAFCTVAADACLIPDPQVFESGFHAAQREESAAAALAWEARAEAGAPAAAPGTRKTCRVTAWDRDGWTALFRGACVLKTDSPAGLRHWADEALRPWVHFIPVASDGSDLDDLVAWLHSHDAEARAIAEAGQALALALTFEQVMEAAAERLGDYLSKEGLLF